MKYLVSGFLSVLFFSSAAFAQDISGLKTTHQMIAVINHAVDLSVDDGYGLPLKIEGRDHDISDSLDCTRKSSALSILGSNHDGMDFRIRNQKTCGKIYRAMISDAQAKFVFTVDSDSQKVISVKTLGGSLAAGAK